ncbi:MAG: SMC-Scp complex subunit ScpB, partial [Desulfobacterales bacterium]
IESLLFVTETPLMVDDIKKALLDAETTEIRDALDSLSKEYDARKGGFYLNEVAGGYQLRTRAEYTEWIKRLLQPKPTRMSRAALETLAIIAYKQPVIRSDVEHIRGVDSGGVLRMLMDRKLIRILGRRKVPGRPLIYATTKLFLEVFDLKDLKELPTPKEIEALEEEADPADEQSGGEVDPNQLQLFESETTPGDDLEGGEMQESSVDAAAETVDEAQDAVASAHGDSEPAANTALDESSDDPGEDGSDTEGEIAPPDGDDPAQ